MPAKIVLALITYLLVNVTWVFFRSPTFGVASGMLAGMTGMHGTARPILATADIALATLCIVSIVACHWLMRDRSLEELVEGRRAAVLGPAWATMLFLVVTSQGSGAAFIYFQF